MQDNDKHELNKTEDQLQKFISWCKKGPESAVVDEVIVFEKEETLFDEFVVIR